MSDHPVAPANLALDHSGDDIVVPFQLARMGQYQLRLYVAGSTPRSTRAIKNLKLICETHLKDHYQLTVIDLYVQQERARDDQVVAAPMLIRQWPLPERRLIGDLSQTDRVLAALDLPAAGAQP